MSKTSIEWTDATWNPTTGCNKVSAGCKFCYAEVMSKRLKGMGQKKYKDGFALRVHRDSLDDPYKWRKPRIVFVNSMSDLFHDDVPLGFIKDVFKVMNETPHHIYQVLTKRASRLAKVSKELTWTSNIWMGVSVEDEKVTTRIDLLRECGAMIKFLSCEPLIGPLSNLNLMGVDWVIVGGESGHHPRKMNLEWVEDIQQQCKSARVAFFFKQWGGRQKKKNGRLLNGMEYNEMPPYSK